LLLKSGGLLVERLGLQRLRQQRLGFLGLPFGQVLLGGLQPSGDQLSSTHLLANEALQNVSGLKAGIQVQGALGGDLGVRDLSLLEEGVALGDKLLRFGPNQDALQLGIHFFEHGANALVARVDLQGLAQQVASFGELILFDAPPAVVREFGDGLLLQTGAKRF